MCHYTHFTTEERELSRVLKAQGLSIRAIARMLNRSPSSVSREFRRNSYSNGTYAAHHADKLYRKRRKNCGRKPKLKASAVRDYVLEKMALRWSPEQIAGRAKRDNEPFSISFPTIYRAIDTGILPPQLKKIMRFKWKHKKCKTEDKRGKIPNTTPISKRPAGAKNRTRFGHWESDTVLGQRKTGCFGTHVERCLLFELLNAVHHCLCAFQILRNKGFFCFGVSRSPSVLNGFTKGVYGCYFVRGE